MLNLTKAQAIAEHRKMWRWIADETKKRGRRVEKEEYFQAMNISYENRPAGNCYCCDYACGICFRCPIEWDSKVANCVDKDKIFDEEGLYSQWEESTDSEEAARLARKIAELPERNG